jgi:hypothetical protein
MTMKSLVRETIDSLLAQHGEATPLAVVTAIRRDHDEDFVDEAFQLAEKYLRQLAREQLAGRSTARESVLPGLELPATYTVPDGEGGFRYISRAKATLADSSADVTIKAKNVAACIHEHEVALANDATLRSAPGACDDMLVSEAVRRLQAA